MTGKRIVFYVLAAFISGTLILSYFQYNFSKNTDSLIRGNQQFLEEYNINTNFRSLERDIVHIESNLSDYVSTGNHNFIIGMNQKFARVENDLVKFQKMALDSGSVSYLNQLDNVVRLKLSFCKEVLDSLNHKGKYSAETLINTLEGKQLMDSIYSIDQKIQDVRHNLITTLNNNNIKSGRQIQSSNIILIVLVLLSSAILFWYIINIIQKLYLSEKKLKNAAAIKENFIANMSHEIRTPMNAILGFTHLLEKENLNSHSKEYVETIKVSGKNLLNIINDILDLSKIEAGMMRIEIISFSLQKVSQSLYEMFHAKAQEKDIDLRLNLDPHLPSHVSGDSAKLLQILVNLLGNAIKFTEKGFIKLDIRKGTEKANIVEVIFIIEDSGIGIHKEKLPFIFNRFQQSDDSISRHYGGTGLGLSIVKELVQLQNGTINVESTINRGTTFTVCIPYGFSKFLEQENTMPGISEIEPAHILDIKILVVEDNAINRRLLQLLFESKGLSFKMAENGNQALDFLANDSFNMILMDLQMPEKDGYRTTHDIREKLHSAIPIIAMTAHAFVTEKEKCLQAGMNDYISKPIDPEKLLALVEKYSSAIKNVDSVTPGNENEPTFKYINLHYLREISAGNKEFEKSISADFLSMFSNDIYSMQKAWEQKDSDWVKKIAHNLKTTIAVMGLGPHLSIYLDALEAETLNDKNFNQNFFIIKELEPHILAEVQLFIQSLHFE